MALRHYFQVAIKHDGLNKHRIIRGADRYLVEASAATQQRCWAEQFAKKVAIEERGRSRENKRQELSENLREATDRTAEAQAILKSFREILSISLDNTGRIDWESMMQPPFAHSKPEPRPYIEHQREPKPTDPEYNQQAGYVMGLVPFFAKRAEQANQERFKTNYAKWLERISQTTATNQRIYDQNLREYEDWHRRATAYEDARTKKNQAVEQAYADYQAVKPEAVLDYCDLVLSQSTYPDCFPQEFELDYRADTKTLIVDYRLPAPTDLPRLSEVKFIRTKGEFSESQLSSRQFEEIYQEVVCQITLRTFQELFQADTVGALDSIVFNGTVHGNNPANGRFEIRYITSVRVIRESFVQIDLRKVTPRKCFDSLVVGAKSKLGDLSPVKPLHVIDRREDRFTLAEDVSDPNTDGLGEWRALVQAISSPTDIQFLPLGNVAQLLGYPATEKFSPALSKELAATVSARGYAIEPDARYGAIAYNTAEEIALFRPLETGVTSAYPGVVALLGLCIMVASADGHISEEELKVTRDFINRHASLTSHEQQRLRVLEQYFCRNPKTAERVLADFAKRLVAEQRKVVGAMLVYIAAADGVITSTEWTALDRARKLLDLPTNALDETLRKLGVSFNQPQVQQLELGKATKPLPDTHSIATFTLDMARVAAISRETEEVIILLSAAMVDTEPFQAPKQRSSSLTPAGQSESLVPSAESPSWLAKLDAKYRGITLRIIEKPSWPPAEFHQLATEFQLMPLAVIDALNEWADENLGDFLLHSEDPIKVNTSILPKLP